ncbi:unnamed protein product [Prorocentrum cordatum]|uniref:Uncharacterized protein n=1 Tax=Prorocentrum cordatum TaxID=2364126 RepID=A0ABN9XUW6_9DINO|nr:unnamed protein product [Polarella glacialis]
MDDISDHKGKCCEEPQAPGGTSSHEATGLHYEGDSSTDREEQIEDGLSPSKEQIKEHIKEEIPDPKDIEAILWCPFVPVHPEGPVIEWLSPRVLEGGSCRRPVPHGPCPPAPFPPRGSPPLAEVVPRPPSLGGPSLHKPLPQPGEPAGADFFEVSRVQPLPAPTEGWGASRHGSSTDGAHGARPAQAAPEASEGKSPGAAGAGAEVGLPSRLRGGYLGRLVQQDEPRCLVPLWLFRWPAQAMVAGFCTLLFGVAAAVLLSAAAGISETSMDYVAGDVQREFVIDEDIDGEALVSYELPEVLMNQKRFVESKDDYIVGSMINRYNCEDAQIRDVGWRRCPGPPGSEECARWRDCPHGPDCPQDAIQSDPILRRLANTSSFRPCGLVSLSMFTDRYRLVRLEDGAEISLVESGVSLDSQDEVYSDKVLPTIGGVGAGAELTVEGVPSWLTVQDNFFEHFKVWSRQPASPRVRNLWARVPGGLSSGRYRLEFLENDRVWTDAWRVPYKRVIISEAHLLGSPGACALLGGVCLVACCLQAVCVCVFLSASRHHTCSAMLS